MLCIVVGWGWHTWFKTKECGLCEEMQGREGARILEAVVPDASGGMIFSEL